MSDYLAFVYGGLAQPSGDTIEDGNELARQCLHQLADLDKDRFPPRLLILLASPAYLQRLNAPSDWTKRVVRHFRDTSRTVCSVAVSLGMGDGAFVGTVRLNSRPGARDIAGQVAASVAKPELAEPGIVALHLLEGRADPTQSAEKALRDRPDQTAAWILLVEATDREPLDRVFAGPISRSTLVTAGVDHGDDDRGIYRLQYALSRDQLR